MFDQSDIPDNVHLQQQSRVTWCLSLARSQRSHVLLEPLRKLQPQDKFLSYSSHCVIPPSALPL